MFERNSQKRKTVFSAAGIIISLAIILTVLFSSGQPGMAVNSLSAQEYTGGNDLLQFTAGNHVLGFKQGEMYIASFDHALKIEFVDAQDVTPEDTASKASPAVNTRAAKPLEIVTYQNIWEGVTLVYEHTAGGVVKSTYHIAPSPGTTETKTLTPVEFIRLRYNVPVSLDVGGNLILDFETGQMRESAPVAWQDIKGQRIPVDVYFRILSECEAGFGIGAYDPLFPLVIDPVLSWNTFLGSASDDKGHSIAVDGSGNIYVAGRSSATWGAPVSAHAGNDDAFAAKLNSSGTLLWNTFMGSTSVDYGEAIAIDGSGNVYVAGLSALTWGDILTVNAHAGNAEAFAAKLNNSGVLQWNTFMGSGTNDYGEAIAVDGSGNNVYIAGYSDAAWGDPVNPYTGAEEAFAVKLDSSGNLQWNTFMGSTSNERGEAIAVDGSGNVYVAGFSESTWGTPVVAFAGNYDAFAIKLDSGGARQWNTFMGSGRA